GKRSETLRDVAEGTCASRACARLPSSSPSTLSDSAALSPTLLRSTRTSMASAETSAVPVTSKRTSARARPPETRRSRPRAARPGARNGGLARDRDKGDAAAVEGVVQFLPLLLMGGVDLHARRPARVLLDLRKVTGRFGLDRHLEGARALRLVGVVDGLNVVLDGLRLALDDRGHRPAVVDAA